MANCELNCTGPPASSLCWQKSSISLATNTRLLWEDSWEPRYMAAAWRLTVHSAVAIGTEGPLTSKVFKK